MRSSPGSRWRSAGNSARILKSRPISSPWSHASFKGQPAPEDIRAEIAFVLTELSATGPIRDVHSVRVRKTPDGLVVNYHCRVSPHLSVDEVHDYVDALDRKMRGRLPGHRPDRRPRRAFARMSENFDVPASVPPFAMLAGLCGHAASRVCSGASFFPSSTTISCATCSPC